VVIMLSNGAFNRPASADLYKIPETALSL